MLIRAFCKGIPLVVKGPLIRIGYNLRYFSDINQSKYYTPRVRVEQFFGDHNLEHRQNGEVFRMKYCPFCTKPHNEDFTNMHTLNVHKESGVFYCHRCRAKGSWLDFKKHMLGINDEDFSVNLGDVKRGQNIARGSHDKVSEVEYFLYLMNLKRNDFGDIKEYIRGRGISDKTMEKYAIGAGIQSFYNQFGDYVDVRVIYFPMFRLFSHKELKAVEKRDLEQQASDHKEEVDSQNSLFESNIVELIKVKIRGSGPTNKKFMRQKPAGTSSGFFGLNLVKKGDKQIVITEGQFDAMAVYEATGIPAISLPQGATSLPDQIVPFLDQFQKIILWMDNDDAGRAGEEKFAHKLGLTRTYIVRNHTQFKDANDFLLEKPEMIQKLMDEARTLPSENILTFENMRDSVKNKIFKFQENLGFQLGWFQFFNRKIKGLRLSELSIVSGPTGSGKTTFLSQATVQIASKGIPVLWGSFQIANVNLATNMLIQHSKTNLIKQKNKFDYFADQFVNLPLYFLSFPSSSDVDKVLGTIEYAIQRLNISVVVIDTLQFLLSGQAEGFQKFQLQDKVMSRLRRMATNYKIHVLIVIHPRKTDDGEDIGIHSIYGTSKAAQEADNIWVIQNRQHFKIFDIKKNRFDGELGKSALGYDKSIKSFFELKRGELQALFKKQKNMDEIISDRTGQAIPESNEHVINDSDEMMMKTRRKKWD